jgi:hypothetical protein
LSDNLQTLKGGREKCGNSVNVVLVVVARLVTVTNNNQMGMIDDVQSWDKREVERLEVSSQGLKLKVITNLPSHQFTFNPTLKLQLKFPSNFQTIKPTPITHALAFLPRSIIKTSLTINLHQTLPVNFHSPLK